MPGDYYKNVFSVFTTTWGLSRKTFLSSDTLRIIIHEVHVKQNLKNFIQMATSKDVLERDVIFYLIERSQLTWLTTNEWAIIISSFASVKSDLHSQSKNIE